MSKSTSLSEESHLGSSLQPAGILDFRAHNEKIWKIGKFDPAVVYTPTFLLMSDSREIGRIEGYPGEDFFWALLNQILDKKTEYKENLQ